MLTFVQFANDECDYGMGYELGMDLFCYGSHVSTTGTALYNVRLTCSYNSTVGHRAVALESPIPVLTGAGLLVPRSQCKCPGCAWWPSPRHSAPRAASPAGAAGAGAGGSRAVPGASPAGGRWRCGRACGVADGGRCLPVAQYFHKTVAQLLPLAYGLLRRGLFARIIEAHLAQRRDERLDQLEP